MSTSLRKICMTNLKGVSKSQVIHRLFFNQITLTIKQSETSVGCKSQIFIYKAINIRSTNKLHKCVNKLYNDEGVQEGLPEDSKKHTVIILSGK